MQPRITTGTAKNKKLLVPEIEGIRVVQDVAKLALFSILGEEFIQNAHCLDLYAGSGSLGIEALSRGAEWCDFVDNDRLAIEVITKNLKNCGFTEKSTVIRQDAIKFAANTENSYKLIFVDPFYTELAHKFLLKNLAEILEPEGVIAFSHGENLNIQTQIAGTDLHVITHRKFGKSHLTFLGLS